MKKNINECEICVKLLLKYENNPRNEFSVVFYHKNDILHDLISFISNLLWRSEQNGGHLGFFALTGLAQVGFLGILRKNIQDTSEIMFWKNQLSTFFVRVPSTFGPNAPGLDGELQTNLVYRVEWQTSWAAMRFP